MPRKKNDPWFKAEASALVSLDAARASENWVLLASLLRALCAARKERVNASHNGNRVKIIQSTEDAQCALESGRYLIQPPLVARDAALFEHAMRAKNISAVVACREPATSLGLCPVVALGSGVTPRVQIEEPKNPTKPSCAWFDHALEELGDHVLEQMNRDATTLRQLDYLLAHLSATPTHFSLYKFAMDLCKTLESKNV